MRLDRVEIQDFRPIHRLELDLHPRMNVLVGANAAGKTSVLEAVAFTTNYLLQKDGLLESDHHFSASDLRRHAGGRAEALEVRLGDPRRSEPWSLVFHPERLSAYNDGVSAGHIDAAMVADDQPLPLAIYYGTDRVVSRNTDFSAAISERENKRTDAWSDAVNSHLTFAAFNDWFVATSIAESLEHSRRRSFDFELPALKAVRDAVRKMIPGCQNLRLAGTPPRIQAAMAQPEGGVQDVDFTEMSDGYRTLLAVVADIARRMAIANPHLGLRSEALVMIDEVDLHLHPKWQQIVLTSLLAAFPNAQFLVTTHAPQVIATVEPEHLIGLVRTEDGLEATRPTSSYGALPDRVLEDIMGVPSARPPEAARNLARYHQLIAQDQGEEPEALALRDWLEQKFRGQDPDLVTADLELRRRRLMRAKRS